MIVRSLDIILFILFLLWSVGLITYWNMLYPGGYLFYYYALAFIFILFKIFIGINQLNKRKPISIINFLGLIGLILATVVQYVYLESI